MDHVAARHLLLKMLATDVIGPSLNENGEPDFSETLFTRGRPENRYLTGYLRPIRDSDGHSQKSSDHIPTIHKEEDSIDEDLGTMTSQNSSSSSGSTFLQPSSMGLTVCPKNKGKSTEISIAVSWGRYKKIGDGEWKRTHHETDQISILTSEIPEKEYLRKPIDNQLQLIFRKGETDHPTITIRIVNDLQVPEGNADSEYIIFQPRISVYSSSGWQDVRKSQQLRQDKTMSILYSDSEILSFGHNVGVDWDDNGEIHTDFFPKYEIPRMIEDSKLESLVPSMDAICSIDQGKGSQVFAMFRSFLERYSEWIDTNEKQLNSKLENKQIDPSLESEATRMVESARKNLKRMHRGVKFLEEDDEARSAFILANRAIVYSQDEPNHPELLRRRQRSGDFKWKPFQLAFQLLNIESLCALNEGESGRKDRGVVDLAWFPTGGGKTEAYLGLIATIGFYRRIRVPDLEKSRPSVHAIMRYTLRLLTSDQSDRLVRLAGAMNYVASQDNPNHGFPEFRVGLWAGQEVSPNFLMIDSEDKYVTAEGSLQRLRMNLAEKKGSVIQFDICPWCGDDSDNGVKNPQNWSVNNELRGQKHLRGFCCNEECLFSKQNGGIPYSCVDDDLYMNPPSLLLATADKFANLARNPFARHIKSNSKRISDFDKESQEFNARRMLGFDGKVRPPDLVIQDELHLLTGPLGTVAGVIETAMDSVWSYLGHQPKYVAATATIRGAESDVQLMYGRDLNIFPPPVSSASDNFFAILDDKPDGGRIHAALLASPRKSKSMTEIPIGSLLQRVHQIRIENPDVPEEVFDPYHTLVVYFNSLRELGGTQSAIPGRVVNEVMDIMANDSNVVRRDLKERHELTSRRTSSELKSVKAALNRRLGIDQNVVDYVLTTNMFQVGIDIPRLGLMAIVGQPKSNSEYIQSSGRVGRSTPGMVLSLLRSTFPRDQSHYEKFRQFHQEVYKHVDVTSTTPFSQRALDRAMASSLSLMLRMGMSSLSGRMDIGRLLKSDSLRDEARKIRTIFKEKLDTRENHKNVKVALEESIEESKSTVDRVYGNMMEFLYKCEQEGIREPAWEIWQPRERTYHNRRGWLENDLMSGESGFRSLSSLRDISPEVRIAKDLDIENCNKDPTRSRYYWGEDCPTMPEGHFFSHAAPGKIWNKDGFSNLTMGINRWQNGHPNGNRNLALELRQDGGQWLDMDSTRDLLPTGLRLRHLPKNEEHGAIAHMPYPSEYGFRCEAGHLSKNRLRADPDRGNLIYCDRKMPNGDECGCEATPTRFVSICRNGHLDNFDYFSWVHRGKTTCDRNVDLDLIYGTDARDTMEDWIVRCNGCGLERSMGRALWIPENEGHFCKGNMPWLGFGVREDCEIDGQPGRMINTQTSSTNVGFQNGGSILLIPLQVHWPLSSNPDIRALCKQTRRGRDTWNDYVDGDEEELGKILTGTPYMDKDGAISWDLLFESCETYRRYHMDGEPLTVGNARLRESQGLIDSRHDRRFDFDAFECRPIVKPPLSGVWSGENWPVQQISRADRIRELSYISGITRLDPDEKEQKIDFPNDMEEFYGIVRDNTGEGIYFDLKPSWVEDKATSRLRALGPQHANMEISMEWLRPQIRDQLPTVQTSDSGGNHLTIVHSLSHLLIKELCEVSGYSLGSIKERLFVHHNDAGELIRAGILLYTSGPSSDGTLGGLSRQATTESIQYVIERALSAISDCSNDPVCFDHLPAISEENGAACHSCLYLPETSCELGNSFLDRRWK